MSGSILVEKLREFKQLDHICDLIQPIIENDKCDIADHLLLEGQVVYIPLVIHKIVFNSNPICRIYIVRGDGLKIQLQSDFSFTEEMEAKINTTYDFKFASKRIDEFTIVDDIVKMMNDDIRHIFSNNDALLTEELQKYLELFIPMLKKCIDMLESLKFSNKGSILRTCRENYRLANDIKAYYNKGGMNNE